VAAVEVTSLYEAVRTAVLAGPAGAVAGLGVLLRGGVPAWLRTCASEARDVTSSPYGRRPPGERPAPRPQELVYIWAQMASTVQKEATDGAWTRPG
jgi:hypothetical protein